MMAFWSYIFIFRVSGGRAMAFDPQVCLALFRVQPELTFVQFQKPFFLPDELSAYSVSQVLPRR